MAFFESFDIRILVWIGAAVAAYFLYRSVFSGGEKLSSYDSELNEILNSEKYRVKGKFEE